jgi:hypothetical protein
MLKLQEEFHCELTGSFHPLFDNNEQKCVMNILQRQLPPPLYLRSLRITTLSGKLLLLLSPFPSVAKNPFSIRTFLTVKHAILSQWRKECPRSTAQKKYIQNKKYVDVTPCSLVDG